MKRKTGLKSIKKQKSQFKNQIKVEGKVAASQNKKKKRKTEEKSTRKRQYVLSALQIKNQKTLPRINMKNLQE